MNIHLNHSLNYFFYTSYKACRNQFNKVISVAFRIINHLGHVLSMTINHHSCSRNKKNRAKVLEVRNYPRISPVGSLENSSINSSLNLPNDVVKVILKYLSLDDLKSTSLTCKKLHSASQDFIEIDSERMAKKRLGSRVAEIFRKNRESWKMVIIDLNTPLIPDSYELQEGFCKIDYSTADDELKIKISRLMSYIVKDSEEGILSILENLKNNGQLKYLHSLDNPLRLAAEYGMKNVDLLIQYGARDYTYENSYYYFKKPVIGKSALYYAIIEGRVETVKILLKKGANPNLYLEKENKILRPLVLLIIEKMDPKLTKTDESNILECFLLLLKRLKNDENYNEILNESLLWAVKYRRLDIAYLVYAMGGRINTIQPDDLNVLIKNSFELNKIEMIKFLHDNSIAELSTIKQFFNSIQDRDKREKILYLIQSDNVEMVQYLHEHSLVDFSNIRDDSSATLLHDSLSYAADKTLNYLIKIGVPQDAKNINNETYLDSGRKALTNNIFQTLIRYTKYGVNYSSIENFNNGKAFEVCERFQINLNVYENEQGKNLLHIALENFSNFKIGNLNRLLDCGIDITKRDVNGDTPLDLIQKEYTDFKMISYDEHLRSYRELFQESLQYMEQQNISKEIHSNELVEDLKTKIENIENIVSQELEEKENNYIKTIQLLQDHLLAIPHP